MTKKYYILKPIITFVFFTLACVIFCKFNSYSFKNHQPVNHFIVNKIEKKAHKKVNIFDNIKEIEAEEFSFKNKNKSLLSLSYHTKNKFEFISQQTTITNILKIFLNCCKFIDIYCKKHRYLTFLHIILYS